MIARNVDVMSVLMSNFFLFSCNNRDKTSGRNCKRFFYLTRSLLRNISIITLARKVFRNPLSTIKEKIKNKIKKIFV